MLACYNGKHIIPKGRLNLAVVSVEWKTLHYGRTTNPCGKISRVEYTVIHNCRRSKSNHHRTYHLTKNWHQSSSRRTETRIIIQHTGKKKLKPIDQRQLSTAMCKKWKTKEPRNENPFYQDYQPNSTIRKKMRIHLQKRMEK